MTRKTEEKAQQFLLTQFRHPTYEFARKRGGDHGFDLWLIDKTDKTERKAELKSHTGSYKRPSNLVERLIFNAEIERHLFESGESVIVRVFTGEEPHRVFVLTNRILSGGASLQPESRYVLRGKINYESSYSELA